MAITNPTLKDVQARRVDVARQRRVLETEDQELAIAERILLQLASSKASDAPQSHTRAQGKGQKGIVLDVLEQGDLLQGQEAIQEAAARLYGVEIKLTSLQPLISKLKAEGTLVKDGNKFALVSRYAREHEDGRFGERDPETASEPPHSDLGL